METRIPDGFLRACSWAACLFTLFGGVTWVASGSLASIFIPLGAWVAARRLYGLWTSMKGQDGSESGFRSGVPALAADLVFLVAVQYGFRQTQIDWGRGNHLGAILSLGVVTPVLSVLARGVALAVGRRVFGT